MRVLALGISLGLLPLLTAASCRQHSHSHQPSSSSSPTPAPSSHDHPSPTATPSPGPPTINQPWTVSRYTVTGSEGEEIASFRLTAPDNYVTGVRGLDVFCDNVLYGLEWDTECASNDASSIVTVNVSYQESFPEVDFKVNHTQIDNADKIIVTGEHFVLALRRRLSSRLMMSRLWLKVFFSFLFTLRTFYIKEF
ncbi:hypothetical protein F5Y17DRAFT_427839 [Xylariaceae sp. FL0594]|nr:hypothetical protein F5Y17DRAFT_427839 [Xylariaceae sp. FL0594]